jgi:hypothetical protein
MFFSFPKDARWNPKRQAVEFGVETASTVAWSGSPGGCSSAYCRSGPLPSGPLKRTTSSGPGSRASLSASCVAAN